ncbi:DUF4825 domain-containing protein [Terribacillus sp. AE2B 122]|uniref:DUF4825 domain-containing protein n=1 Tax=Terribacillus sp. AE2B 122 TaxID=1331902 RepID=UPI001581B2D6|nr:DUF4825 domain-containing protein [Terribacillus sp. AE2B 122]
MRLKITSAAVILTIGLSLTACSNNEDTGVSIESVEPVELQEYQETFIGSNSDVSGILSNLPGNTMQKEYSVADQNLAVSYDTGQLESQQDDGWYNNENGVKETFYHNSLYIAALIDNVEQIEFSLVNEQTEYSWTISKTELEDFLETDLSEEIKHEQAWKDYINEQLKTKNIESIYEEFPLEIQ